MRKIRGFLAKSFSLLTIALLMGAMSFYLKPVQGQYEQGRYYLDPSDNIFSTDVTSVGTLFNVSFYAFNLTSCISYQFRVYTNSSILDITRAWRAQWDPNWVFAGQGTVGTIPSIGTDLNGKYALVADATLGGASVTFNTSKIMGIVEFNITSAPTSGMLQCALNITNANTFWLGPLPTNKHFPVRENGNYEYHFVAIPPTQPYFTVEPNAITMTKPREFTVDVMINNLLEEWHLIGLQFKLKYNASYLEAISVTNGSFLMPWAIYGTFPMGFIDEDMNEIVFGDLLLPSSTGQWDHPEFPSGSGVVATITFIPSQHTAISFGLNILDVNGQFFLDRDRNYIPYDDPENCTYTYDPLVTPSLNVDPSLYTASSVGETFDVDITIADLDAEWMMTYAEFKLMYNASFLEVVNVAEGPFMAQFGSTTFNYEEGTGYVKMNITVTPTPYPSGSGILATVTFNVTASPGFSTLSLTETELLDFEDLEILHDAHSGRYRLHERLIHPITWDSNIYDVITVSNTSVAPVPMIFLQPHMLVYFNATGFDGTIGFIEITIPKALIDASPTDWLVIVGGEQVVPIVTENATHTTLYFTFDLSLKSVYVKGTSVVPELSPIVLLLALFAATLAVLAAAKLTWKRKQPVPSIRK